MKRIVSSRRRLARVCVISAGATKRFLPRCPAVCRDRLRGCVNLAGARKRIFEVCVTLNINWHHQGAAFDGLLVPPKTVGLWFSHPRKVQILFALCPSLVIAASWATTPTLPAVGSKIDTPGTCGFVE